jgi:hypothetical protein
MREWETHFGFIQGAARHRVPRTLGPTRRIARLVQGDRIEHKSKGGTIMIINKFMLLALGGCVAVVTAYVVRRQDREEATKRLQEDLHTWEGEGGLPAPPPARPGAAP